MYELINDINTIMKNQEQLKLNEFAGEYVLSGKYFYTLEFNGYCVEGNKNIKFIIPKNFPNSIPTFFVYDYPKDIEHIYPDHSVCLATLGEIISYVNNNSSILKFWNKFINSFIFTIEWFDKYNNYPFGDRDHGYKGLKDFYLDDLNLTMDQYKMMVSIIYNNSYRGHNLCFCSSGKKIRNCHGSFVLPIIKNKQIKNIFLNEAWMILSKDGKE